MQMKCILSRHYAWSVVNFHFMLPSNVHVCVCMCVCAHTHGCTCLCTEAKENTRSSVSLVTLFLIFLRQGHSLDPNWAFWLGLLGSKFHRSGYLSVFILVMQRLQACVTMLGFVCILGFNPWLSCLCSKCTSSSILTSLAPWQMYMVSECSLLPGSDWSRMP